MAPFTRSLKEGFGMLCSSLIIILSAIFLLAVSGC